MHFGVAFVANLQAAKPIPPRVRPIHHPPMATQSLLRFDTGPRDPWHDAPRPQGSPFHPEVVVFVAMQLRRPLPNRRDGVHRRFHPLTVIDVGCRPGYGQRDATAVAPPGAATVASSLFNTAWWSFCPTPACCYARKRRPPLGRSRSGSNNGSMSPHNSSDTSSCAIPLHTF